MATPLNLLLVEDNTDDAEIMLAQLRTAGFEVQARVVATETNFLAALTPEPDVILCDYRLPGFSGAHALELLKARGLDIPFILVSGTIGEELATQFMRDGVADYLLKDRLARLGSAVAAVLEQKRSRVREILARVENQALAEIVRSSDDAIIGVTLQGTIASWNHGAQRMLGYTAAEIVGNDVSMIVPAALRDQARSNFEQSCRDHRAPHFETTRLHQDGTEIHVSLSTSPIRDAEGKIVGVAKVMRNISALKSAMDELNRKTLLSQMLSAAAEKVNTATSAAAALGACLALLCRHGDWTIGHVVTFRMNDTNMLPLHSIWEVAEPARFKNFMLEAEQFDYAKGSGQFIAKVISTQQPIWIPDINHITLSRTAMLKPLGIRCAFAMPVVVGGKVAALMELFAGQARAPDALLLEAIPNLAAQLARVIERENAQASDMRLAAIVETSQDGLVIASPDGTILTWNTGAEKIFGYARDEIVGRNCRLLLPNDRLQEVLRQRQGLLADGFLEPFETERLTKHQHRVAVSVSASAVKSDTGAITGFATTYRNISQRKQQEQKIEKLSRMRAISSAVNAAIVRLQSRQELLQEVCRIAVEQGSFGVAWIGSFDPAAEEITPVAWVGIDAEHLHLIKTTTRTGIPQGYGHVGRAIRERKPVFNNNLGPGVGGARAQEMRRCGYHSAGALPLFTAQAVAGVLVLYAHEANFFSDEEILLLQEIASNVSFAIDYIAKQQKLDKLARMRTVSSEINALIVHTRERQQLFDETCRIAVEHGGFGMAWVGVLDPRTLEISPAAWAGADAAALVTTNRNNARADSPLGQSIVGRAVRTKRVEFSNDIAAETSQGGARRVEALRRGYRSVISLPLVVEDTAVGALSLFASEPDFFDNEEVGVLTELSANVAFALELIQKDEALARNNALTRLNAAVAAAANEAINPEAALQSALHLIAEHGAWLLGHLFIFTPDTVNHYHISVSMWHVGDRARFSAFIAASDRANYKVGKRLVGKAIAEKLPVWLEDIAVVDAGRRFSIAVAAGLRCAFAIPVVVQNEVVAILEFYAEGTRPPDRLLLDNIANIAAQLARVIERARSSEVHSRLAGIVESSQDAIISSTPDATILTWNAGAEKMLGYTSAEAVGMNLSMLVPNDRVLEIETRRQHRLSSGIFETYETERLTKDQRRVAVSVNPSPMKDGMGNVTGYAAIYRDITEREAAAEHLRRLYEDLEKKVVARTVDLERTRNEAEEANRAKSMFLATMSHEIRTPMNGVIGMIDVLHQTSLRGDQVEMVDLIRESAFSLLGIINDILDFSKIEAGKFELESEALAVADVVEGVGSLMNNMAEKKNVTLTMFVDPAIPVALMGDALRLRQVLINLINNAIKFSSGKSRLGRVAVRGLLVERTAQRVTVEFRVIDNGIGMDDKAQARLFTAFTQADASTTRRFGGTGLGLTIANQLVELMGGEITAQSAPGEGATFKVRVPFIAVPQNSAVDTSRVAGLSCVVVGDREELAGDLATYLEHADAEVERVPDLTAARNLVAERTGIAIWIVDAGDERHSEEQLRAFTHAEDSVDVRRAWVVVERGKRRRPRLVAPNLLTVDGNALGRQNFLRVVAVAAGRASLDTDAQVLSAGKTVAIAPSRDEALRRGRLILVAEDNETNQKVILRQLALLGHTADITGDGIEALNRWRKGGYALLLTDLHMPAMDGYELSEAIRAAEPADARMPIIALTANVLKGEADRCRDVGMDDYCSKPIPLEGLKVLLEKWLPHNPSAALAPAVSPSSDPPDPSSTPFTRAVADSPVDVNVLKELVGDDPEMLREFLQDFRASAATIAAELRGAYAARQPGAAAAAAHKLKSSARSVGALALGELCAAIEAEGNASAFDALAVLLPRFDAEMAVVDDWLGRSSI